MEGERTLGKKLHLKEEMNVGNAFAPFPKKKMLTVLFTKRNKTCRYQQLSSLQENVFFPFFPVSRTERERERRTKRERGTCK